MLPFLASMHEEKAPPTLQIRCGFRGMPILQNAAFHWGLMSSWRYSRRAGPPRTGAAAMVVSTVILVMGHPFAGAAGSGIGPKVPRHAAGARRSRWRTWAMLSVQVMAASMTRGAWHGCPGRHRLAGGPCGGSIADGRTLWSKLPAASTVTCSGGRRGSGILPAWRQASVDQLRKRTPRPEQGTSSFIPGGRCGPPRPPGLGGTQRRCHPGDRGLGV